MSKVLLHASFEGYEIQASNGTSNGKSVILCSSNKFEFLDDDGYRIAHTDVIFEKELKDVFLDDEFDLEEFGVTSKNQAAALDEIEQQLDSGRDYSIENLVKFGLSFNTIYSWYGCFVYYILPTEIKRIRKIRGQKF